MDVTTNPEVCLPQDHKILHLVRHGEAVHNVAKEENHDQLLSRKYFDAPLSPKGWGQVDRLRNQVHVSGLTKRIDVVVTSPLLRALQTAAAVFGGGSYNNESGNPPLMVTGAGKSNRNAISSQNCPPFIAVELCRETAGLKPCNERRSIKESKTLFPAVDFSEIESDEDNLGKSKVRESTEEIVARGIKFLNWLGARKEKEIAIVTHHSFLLDTLNAFREDGKPLFKNKDSNNFENCELRSLILFERRSSGSGPGPGPAPSLKWKDSCKFDLMDYGDVISQG